MWHVVVVTSTIVIIVSVFVVGYVRDKRKLVSPVVPEPDAPAPSASTQTSVYHIAPGEFKGVVRCIDVSSCEKGLRPIGSANATVVAGAIVFPISFLSEAVANVRSFSGDGLAVAFALWLCCPNLIAAIFAWQNRNIVSAVVRPWTVASLLILSVCNLVSAVLVGLASASADELNRVTMLLGAGTLVWTSVVVIRGAIAIVAARKARIEAIGTCLAELIDRLERDLGPDVRPIRIPPKNVRAGILLICLGTTWMVALQQLDNYLAEHGSSQSNARLSLLGFVCFLYARHYLQPDPRDVANSDRRPPVLWLRPFLDDEVSRWVFPNIETALIDFSLESRLSSHFSRIGPFVAVGSPKGKWPLFGAARKKFTDEEWQEAVLEWMDVSKKIVAMVGTTKWIAWELSNIFARGHAGKLILIFPEKRLAVSWFGRGKRYDRILLEVIESVLSGTTWSGARLRTKIGRSQDIRAMTFAPNGDIVIVSSKKSSRNAYHLAALVADYTLTRGLEDNGMGQSAAGN